MQSPKIQVPLEFLESGVLKTLPSGGLVVALDQVKVVLGEDVEEGVELLEMCVLSSPEMLS